MEVFKSILPFTFEKKRYEANVRMFKPAQKWMLWVNVPLEVERKKSKNLVLVFYKIRPGELFWFDLPNEWEQMMAKVIADKLLKD